MASHEEDDKLHLRMAMDTTVRLENKTVELQDTLKALREPPLKFKLIDYEKKKANSEYVESPSYYTSPNGYRVALRVDANGYGDGKGTHVSVFSSFLEGEYDDQLKWPFIGKITLTLLNQLENKNHYQMTAPATAASNLQVGNTCTHEWGYAQFIPHSALDYDVVNNTQYLKDNTLYFRMSVKPADQDKHWLQ